MKIASSKFNYFGFTVSEILAHTGRKGPNWTFMTLNRTLNVQSEYVHDID